MKPDFIIEKGSPHRPACIFVHGLGMDMSLWVEPSKARIMGGFFPFELLIRDNPELETLYSDFMRENCTVAVWSQRRPVGPAESALEELFMMLDHVSEVKNSGIILIGHSRGGLIARLAASARPDITAVITLSSPHRGSSMARWAVYLTPLTSLLDPLVPENERGKMTRSVRRSLDFLRSRAVQELLPGSEFLEQIARLQPRGEYRLSTGGTSPQLLTIPRLFSFPGSLEKLLPGTVLPNEMKQGLGDGLVSAESSIMPHADTHLNFDVNHAEMVVSPDVRRAILERLRQRNII